MQQEAREFYKTLTPDEALESKTFAYGMVIAIFIVIVIFLFIIGGQDAVLGWLKSKSIK